MALEITCPVVYVIYPFVSNGKSSATVVVGAPLKTIYGAHIIKNACYYRIKIVPPTVAAIIPLVCN